MMRFLFIASCARLSAIALVMAAVPAFAAYPPEWTEPVKTFRIAPGITYVGTRGLSAYLIETDAGAILLEGTMPANAALIERNIESVGVALHQVKILIANHAHIDHAGALAKIKADTGARVLAGAQDRWALEHGVPRGDTDYGVLKFPAVAVDGIVRDGQQVRLGTTVLTAHLTPGHTPGCTTWTMTVTERGRPLTVMFLGSVSVAGNLLTCNHAYPGIVTEFRATLAKLARMKADIVLTGHPEVSDMFARAAKAQAGDADAFVDPAQLGEIVAVAKMDFEAELVKSAKPEK